ncbi:MAG: DUF4349 domain-containing protein [Oscillospiraceae bacterium]
MKKLGIIAVTFLLSLIICTSCGNKSVMSSNSATAQMAADRDFGSDVATPAAAPSAPQMETGSADEALPECSLKEDASAQPAERKLVLNADLQMESTDFDAACKAIVQEVALLSGYVESSSQDGALLQENSHRYAEYTVRIPADKYNTFITKAGDAANLISKQENVQDITAQYIDVDARLKSLRAQEESLLKILEKAEKLEDVIALQESLSNVQYQIESFTAQQRLMDSEVSFSKVHISIREVKRVTEKQDSFISRLSVAFKNGIYNFGDSLQSFVIQLTYSLPMLILFAAFATAFVFAILRVRKKHKANAAKRLNSHMDIKNQQNDISINNNDENK